MLVMEKIDARTLSTEAQQQLRHQAIRLREAGRTYDDIANVVGVHKSTVCGWWRAYQAQGLQGIEIKQRGRRVGSCRRLDPDQERQLQKLLSDKMPDQLKLPFALWTRRAVQDLVRSRWSIELPIRTVGDYLKRWAEREGRCRVAFGGLSGDGRAGQMGRRGDPHAR